jgi:hypothetical protein
MEGPFQSDRRRAWRRVALTCSAFELSPVLTDADGTYRVDGSGLDPGDHEMDIDYDSDVEHWAARTGATPKLK